MVDTQLFHLLNGLSYYVKHSDRKIVSLLIQYILSEELYNTINPIHDTFGLFKDLKEDVRCDPVWYIWFFIILYVKQQILTRQSNVWEYFDKLILHNLYVYKAFYSRRDRGKRLYCIIKIYDAVIRQSEDVRFKQHEQVADADVTVKEHIENKWKQTTKTSKIENCDDSSIYDESVESGTQVQLDDSKVPIPRNVPKKRGPKQTLEKS